MLGTGEMRFADPTDNTPDIEHFFFKTENLIHFDAIRSRTSARAIEPQALSKDEHGRGSAARPQPRP